MISSFLKNEERIKAIISFDTSKSHVDIYGESMANGEIRGFSKSMQKSYNSNKTNSSLIISKVLENYH